MVDIIVLVADGDVERMTMHNATSSFLLLEQGRKIEAMSITDHTGGGAINAGVAMARLGHRVSTLIKIGEDRDGARIEARLKEEGISLDCVRRTDGLPTGTAVMVSSHDRNATIFTQRGANTLLTPEDLNGAAFEARDMVYVTNLSNRSADCFPDIVRNARAAGAFVAANPGIRQLTSRTRAFLDSLPDIDLLALNAVEAGSLVPAICADCRGEDTPDDGETAGPRLLRDGLEYAGYAMGLLPFLSELRRRGVSAVVVTDGKDGACLATEEGVFHCPAMKVAVKGTAGGGDAFTATVCASLIAGLPSDEALRRATVNAASVVADVDAQSGLLTEDALCRAVSEAGDAVSVARLSDPV